MKTKKLIAVFLCAILTCFALVGCKEEEVGDYLDHYDWWSPEVIVDLSYDLYIISDCDKTADAEASMLTVQSKINQILSERYHTTVNIHYIPADEYEEAINGVVSSLGEKGTATGSKVNGGSIVLVKGKDMYDSLIEKGALVDISSCLQTEDFGKLNTQLTESVLESAYVTDDAGKKLFVIPNDHVVGEYTYTVIDRAFAEGELNFSAQTELHEMFYENGQPNEIAQELIDAVVANYPEKDVSDVIKEVKGPYEYKAEIEAQGYICNVSEYPAVTVDETFAAGFGILTPPTFDYDLDDNKDTANETLLINRAMDVIYTINTDVEVRNLLQYGVEYINYKFEDKIVVNDKGEEIHVKYVVPMPDNAYKMNLLYTGDMFNAYFCEAWTYEMLTNGDKQNSESFIKK